MKRCHKCKEFKDETEFYKDRTTKDGLKNKCKECSGNGYKIYREKFPEKVKEDYKKWALNNKEKRKEYNKRHSLKQYGITIEDYNNMLKEQDFKCAICKEEIKNVTQFDVDHCHLTGIVRGILCSNCNNGLGRFKDNIEVLKNAIKYLEDY
jgi:hypothetical protein